MGGLIDRFGDRRVSEDARGDAGEAQSRTYDDAQRTVRGMASPAVFDPLYERQRVLYVPLEGTGGDALGTPGNRTGAPRYPDDIRRLNAQGVDRVGAICAEGPGTQPPMQGGNDRPRV